MANMDAADDFYTEDYDEDDYLDDDGGDDNFDSNKNQGVHEQNYAILKEADIRQCMDQEIAQLSTDLSITKQEASLLLRHYNWSVGKVHDEWFADESQVRKRIGLFLDINPEQKQEDSDGVSCGICFESFRQDFIKSAACGHPFCDECWGRYINTNVNDGPGCLMLRCPEPTCTAAVGDDIVDELASEEDRKKYHRYLARSYVESSKRRKWCPAPGCDYAIDFDFVPSYGDFDVTCLCSHSFCFNCCEERHRPVGCDTVAKWNLNNEDCQNEVWKKAYTKPCPKCNRPIEKNAGCMRMVCPRPCSYEFCWLCRKHWSAHGYAGACNQYCGNHITQETTPLQLQLLKYQHYYDRWAANEKSRQIAFSDLQKVRNIDCKKIERLYGQPESQLDFLTEAWQQIVVCRRVLKWTYAYGYYLPVEEEAKTQLFEYLQGQAELSLERLHDCAEREFKSLLDPNEHSDNFTVFKEKLTRLTVVTKNFFENLVTALENGLPDVADSWEKQNTTYRNKIRTAGGKCYSRITNPAYSRYKPKRPFILPNKTRAQTNTTDAVIQNTVQPEERTADNLKPQDEYWSCMFCTCVNPGAAETCEACDQGRGAWPCQNCTFANPRTAMTCQMCAEDEQE